MFDVLFTAPYMLPFVDRFRPVFDHYGINLIVADVKERLSEDALLKFAGSFDGTICGDDAYTENVIKACVPRLKVLSKWGTGIDSFDQEAARKHNVKICNTRNAFTLPVADSVMAYILAFARKQTWMDRAMKTGEWKKIMGHSLSESTLGVIGVGNIGKAVLKRARAFGMKLLGNDIIQIPADFITEYGVEVVSLEHLLKRSDYVSLNCDMNKTSWHLINKSTLELMRSNAVIVNTARGHIINEKDLIQALEEKKIAGAALDVFEEEPLPKDSQLLKMDNVMLAPHNCNSSPSAWERVHWNTIRNLLMALDIDCTDFEEIKNTI